MPINIPPNLSTSQYEHLVLQALSQIAGPGANITSIPSILSTSDFRHLVLYALNYIADKGTDPSGPAGGDLAGTYPNPTVKSSVALTGTPTAPTPNPGNNSTEIATTAYVQSAITGGTGSAQTLIANAVNQEGFNLTRGMAVYASGSVGNKLAVKTADNTTDATSSRTLGFINETTVAPGANCTVTLYGTMNQLDLGSPFVDGDVIYLGVNGGYTKTPPVAPDHSVVLGIVERANSGNGIAFVKVQNGYELSELHDVLIQNPQDTDLLVYDGLVWQNRTAAPALVHAAPEAPIAAININRSGPAAVIRPWYGNYIQNGFDGNGNAIYQKGIYLIEYDNTGVYVPAGNWVIRDISGVVVSYSDELINDPWTNVLPSIPLMKSSPALGTYVYDNDPGLGGPTSLTFCHATTTVAAGGQTYFFSYPYDLTMNLAATNRVFQFPYYGTIIGAYLGAFTGATAPVGQATGASIDLHNFTQGTSINILPGIVYGTLVNRMQNYVSDYLNSGAGIPINPVDEFSIRVVSPTFTTPPALRHYLNLFIRRDN